MSSTVETSTIQPEQIQPLLQINIGLLEGVITIVIFLIGIGIAWGSIITTVRHIKNILDKKIEPELNDIAKKVAILWQDKIAPAHSPRQLNDKGNLILTNSGIKEIIDTQKIKLTELIKAQNATNPYDAEAATQKVVMDIPNNTPELLETIKIGAFKTGVDINTVLFVGGIYLRNLIFSDLGFQIEDLDKPKGLGKK